MYCAQFLLASLKLEAILIPPSTSPFLFFDCPHAFDTWMLDVFFNFFLHSRIAFLGVYHSLVFFSNLAGIGRFFSQLLSLISRSRDRLLALPFASSRVTGAAAVALLLYFRCLFAFE